MLFKFFWRANTFINLDPKPKLVVDQIEFHTIRLPSRYEIELIFCPIVKAIRLERIIFDSQNQRITNYATP